MTWTVIGARGFIGSSFVRALQGRGESVRTLTHVEALDAVADLGDVLYATGVAWDADKRPADASRMHVDVPRALLQRNVRSLLYLSSTRVYGDDSNTAEEATLPPGRDVYAQTKAAGEAVVLADARPSMRVIRLSNVYGASFDSGLMLSDFLRQAATTGKISVRSSEGSSKDHVSVDDVVELGLRIAREGRERIYNVAAGRNTVQGDLLRAIAAASGCAIDVAPHAPTVTFAPIAVGRVRAEFSFVPRNVLDDIPALWNAFASHFQQSLMRAPSQQA